MQFIYRGSMAAITFWRCSPNLDMSYPCQDCWGIRGVHHGSRWRIHLLFLLLVQYQRGEIGIRAKIEYKSDFIFILTNHHKLVFSSHFNFEINFVHSGKYSFVHSSFITERIYNLDPHLIECISKNFFLGERLKQLWRIWIHDTLFFSMNYLKDIECIDVDWDPV